MPYKAFSQNGEYCVYKVDASDKRTGDSLGCHSSLQLANDQVAALYASEGKELDMTKQNEPPQEETKEAKGKTNDKGYYTPAASFAELAAIEKAEEVEEMAEYFPSMVGNIMNRPDIADKGEAMRALAIEFIGVVNEKIAENKETTKEVAEPEETEATEAKDEPQPVDEESLFNRLMDKAKSALGLQDDNKQKQSEVYIWKDADTGKYKCVLAYSNNFRDDDNPPEIITAESHKGFDDALNKGEWPLPELWLWHVDYPVGHVDFHAYDEKSGFSVAAATFDEAWAAEALLENKNWDALSHGMPRSEIVRDDKDDSLIVRHRTKEISFLPKWAAANKLTFHYIKESDMKDQTKGLGEKRANFVSLIGEDKTAELEGTLAGKSEKAKEEGLEQKEAAEEKAAPEEQPLTRNELFEALKFVTDEIKAIKEEMHKEVEQKEEAEPQDLVAMLKQHSAIGAEETKVDGRTKEAKDGPAEAPAAKAVESVYGVPLLDNLLNNKQRYTEQAGLNVGKLPPALLSQVQQEAQ